MNELKRIFYEDKEYFVDYRLSEIRDVKEPWSSIRFEDIADKDLLKQLRENLALGILKQMR